MLVLIVELVWWKFHYLLLYGFFFFLKFVPFFIGVNLPMIDVNKMTQFWDLTQLVDKCVHAPWLFVWINLDQTQQNVQQAVNRKEDLFELL